MPPDNRLLVITDLDATLLDASYDFAAAQPALDALRDGGHQVALASSKTLAEMEMVAARLSLSAPIVAENGGVLAWPRDDGGWRVEKIGRAHV